MQSAPLTVLYEDNHLLAVLKPPGIATMGAPSGTPTLVEAAKQYIGRRYHKPGNVYLGVVSRLDAAASGVVIFARTSKAARRLTQQFRNLEVEKTYWAIVTGRVEPSSAAWVDWLVKDEPRRRMRVGREGEDQAKLARLSYTRKGRLSAGDWLEIRLETGRKHQIRVQCAQRGHPVLGDAKYGSRVTFGAGLALHARRLVIRHPTRAENIELEAPLAAVWRRHGVCEPAAPHDGSE